MDLDFYHQFCHFHGKQRIIRTFEKDKTIKKLQEEEQKKIKQLQRKYSKY
ncbi:hypothetical protein [Methanosphaera sp.]